MRRKKRLLPTAAMVISALSMCHVRAASVTVPGVRDNVSNAISRTTSPATGAVDKVIGPASEVAPTIGETTAPVNDSAMFRANSALKDQVASDTGGVIDNN